MVAGVASGVDRAFWQGRRVLVTGHTGFKGGWLSLWLARLGATVTGIGLDPETNPSLFVAAGVAKHVDSHILNITDAERVAKIVRAAQPEIVFHLAAQPLVRESYRRPLMTFASNVMGTANVLDAIRDSTFVRAAVMITTDKVYANREWAYPYREDDVLGGHDPYAASKAACELLIDSYRVSFLAERNVAVASVRAGNVIGGGDWSAERLIPDAIRAWTKGDTVYIRRPEAVRPWQHVMEPIYAYLILAQSLWGDPFFSQAFNIGPTGEARASVQKVVMLACAAFGRGEISFNTEVEGPHESGTLALETSKARELLKIVPRWTLEQAVARTMEWYAAFANGDDAAVLCATDIEAFEMAF